jgi:NAD(P)-dependent dehydrogenase (short-subunit alcohol dehydrogenase family)
MSLKGQTVLICGGCKNLGALIARTLHAEGAQLALHYNSASTKQSADELAKSLGAKVYQGDLTTGENVRKLFEWAASEIGKPNIVINTVGMVIKKPMVDISEAEYDQMFAVNSKSAFFITQEAAKHVQDGGKIINIVTALLAVYTPFYTLYQGSKAPVEWFTKGLSKELMSRGISVNAIAPGPMDTSFFYPQENDDSVAFFKTQAMNGRLTKIEDIAPIVKFLCTDGGWISGQSTLSPSRMDTKSCKQARFSSQMEAWQADNEGWRTLECRCRLGTQKTTYVKPFQDHYIVESKYMAFFDP